MGQIIPFPASVSAYPARSTALEGAEALLLLGVRWWVDDVRRHEDPLPRLRQGMGIAGAPDAALPLDTLMKIAGRTAQHVLEIHAPRCECLSLDETHLLHAASMVQAGSSARAERALRTALLSAQGADMALGPLQGIGRLFSAARLLLRRRLDPAAVPPGGNAGMPAPSPSPAATLH